MLGPFLTLQDLTEGGDGGGGKRLIEEKDAQAGKVSHQRERYFLNRCSGPGRFASLHQPPSSLSHHKRSCAPKHTTAVCRLDAQPNTHTSTHTG